MSAFYAITAYSRIRNQTQRELGEDELKGRPQTDSKRAEKMADAFAQRLNSQKFLNTFDWTGRIELINNTLVKRL
jgi:hypothetical protein